MHLHGQSFKIVATDGNPVPPAAQLVKDTVNIAPAERYDLVVEGTNPGVWMFHCHINNHAANGMSTVLQYDGYEPYSSDLSHAAHGPEAPNPVASPAGGAPKPPTPTPTPAPAGTPGPSSSSSPAAGAADGAAVTLLDNRFTPNNLTVKSGTTVTWTNNGTNAHTITSFNGVWDSGLSNHGNTYTFTFSQPGTYKYYCRQHVLQGMTGTIVVTPP
jgi:plastocyanin